MTALDVATATAAADRWAAGGPNWDDDQRHEVADWLVRLSAKVTPHLVRDLPIADADLQEFLLARTMARLDDWLVGAATTILAGHGLAGFRHTAPGVRGVGLRSATMAEIAALPGVDEVGATRVSRYLARRPAVHDMDALIDVAGIGAGRLEQLRTVAYIERPRVGLVSPSLWAFLDDPRVETFLGVLARTDLFLWFGDHNTAARRLAAASDDPFDRFVAFLALVDEQASKTISVADTTTTAEADDWLTRRRLQEQVAAAASSAAVQLLPDRAYLPAVRAALEQAGATIDLQMFLGTSAVGSVEDPGPGQLVDALVDAAGRGVRVRVVLDQDDGGEPYRSAFINRPLAKRLQDAAVSVKFDQPGSLLHSKVVIIDDMTTVVGSHNWTANSMVRTHELSVLATSRDFAQRATARFQQIWDELPDLPPIP